MSWGGQPGPERPQHPDTRCARPLNRAPSGFGKPCCHRPSPPSCRNRSRGACPAPPGPKLRQPWERLLTPRPAWGPRAGELEDLKRTPMVARLFPGCPPLPILVCRVSVHLSARCMWGCVRLGAKPDLAGGKGTVPGMSRPVHGTVPRMSLPAWGSVAEGWPWAGWKIPGQVLSIARLGWQ